MSTFNKGTLDAYRKIVTREIVTRTLVATGSVNIGGNLYVTGSITASGGGLGTGDMSKSVYDVSNSGSVDNSSKLDGLDLAGVRTHAPASHSGSHASGSGDAVSIFKSQIRDISGYTLTAPQLTITGSSDSSISGNLIVTGSISGSYYEGPVMNIRTGSVYTFSRRRLNVVSGGAMIINMSEDPVNDEVVLTLQSTGSGGAGTGLADTVTSGMVYGTLSGSGIASNASRSDHQHGTPSLGLDNALDVSGTASSGSIATGSKVDHVHRGVLSVSASGSSDLYSRVYITGSTGITLTQSGQILTLVTDPNNLSAVNITASTLLSGSDIHAPTATIDALTSIGVTATTVSGSTISGSSYIGDSSTITNINAVNITGSSIVSGSSLYSKDLTSTNINSTNITGSTVSGSTIYGLTAKITNVNAINVTGSQILSGANIYSPVATITNVNATNITGSILSGSTIYGANAYFTTVTSANITGSTLIAGTNFAGSTSTVTNQYVTNLSGSGTISGSVVIASTLQAVSFAQTNVNAITVTGSTLVSGSTVYANTLSGSKAVITGDISGSSYSGAVVSVRTGSGATTYARKRLNFINAGGIICNVQDDEANSEIQVQLQASAGGITPSDTVVAENVFGQSSNAGTSVTLSRGDHTHGSPSLSASNAQDVGTTASAGTVNTGSRVDHVHRGVFSVAYSGSSAMYGAINVTGSSNINIAQGTQSLTISLPTSLTLTNVTGSTSISGSIIRGASATITNVNAINVTGSLISGSDHRGPTATITSINVVTITGSTSVSGSTIYGKDVNATNINATNITGSVISGSTLYASTATLQSISIPNLTSTNVTGSTSVSGSNIYGANATITNINVTNLTGSIISGSTIRGLTSVITNVIATNVTGSLISGSDHRGATATITNHFGTNVSGSGTVSGSIIRGSDITGSHLGVAGNAVVTGNLSGSSISGSITMNMDGNARVAVRQNSGGTGYLRRRINLIEGAGVSLTIGDDSANEEVDVTITTSTATISGSKGPYTYIIYSGSGAGGPYFAKDTDGILRYSGSEATTILRSVISTDPPLVYIAEGTYDVSSGSLQLQNDTKYHFKGAGQDLTVFDAGTGANAKVFEIVDSGNYPYWGKFITIEGMSINSTNGYGLFADVPTMTLVEGFGTPWFTLRDLNFGNHTTGKGCKYAIKINAMYMSYFENIRIYTNTSGSYGIWLTNTSGGWMCGNSAFYHIHFQSDNNTATGFFVDATQAINSNINLIDVFHYEAHGGDVGIHFKASDATKSTINNISFNGIDIEGADTASIKLEARTDLSGAWGQITWSSFRDLYLDTPIVVTGVYGTRSITFDGGTISTYNGTGDDQGRNITLRGMSMSGFTRHNGEGIQFHDCENFVLENSGTSTGTGAQQTIAHGLTTGSGVAPTRLMLGNLSSGSNPFQSAAADTTNIYVTATTGKDYVWRAWVDWAAEEKRPI